MNCMKCGTDMFRAGITWNSAGTFPAGIYNKEKGVFGITKYSPLSCYVCPACGHVELSVDDPGKLIINGTSIFEEDEQ